MEHQRLTIVHDLLTGQSLFGSADVEKNAERTRNDLPDTVEATHSIDILFRIFEDQNAGTLLVLTSPTTIQLWARPTGTFLDAVDIANYNSPMQTVISGPKEHIDNAAASLQEAGAKRIVVLHVSGAFHSRYMQEAADEFGEFIARFTFAEPRIPVIANCTAQPYTRENVAENLTRQIHSPVLWVDTIRFLKDQSTPEFSEVGPGKVLTNLLRSIK